MQQNREHFDNNIHVELLHSTPQFVLDKAITVTTSTRDKIDNVSKLYPMLIREGHLSVFEHISYTFDVKGVTRDLLQELARHRIGVSLSVKSTRYTLKKDMIHERTKVLDLIPDESIRKHFRKVYKYLDTQKESYPNDVLKYLLIGGYETDLVITVNARSLFHLLELRLSKRALLEFQVFAKKLLDLVSQEHTFWEYIRKELPNI